MHSRTIMFLLPSFPQDLLLLTVWSTAHAQRRWVLGVESVQMFALSGCLEKERDWQFVRVNGLKRDVF